MPHTGKQFADHPVFCPVTADYRGRLYTVGELTYQGDHLSLALSHFHPTEPLTPDGFEWCLRSAAAAHQGRHLTFDERLSWGRQNLDLIEAVGQENECPIEAVGATDPWRFIAACQAIITHIEDPQSLVGFPLNGTP